MSKTWYQTTSFPNHLTWVCVKNLISDSFLPNQLRPVYVKNLISDSFLPNQLTSLCQKPDIRLLPSKPIDQSVSKTWYQTPSFPTNWLVSAKNLISDYFLSNQLTSVCQQTDQTPSSPTNWPVYVKNLISDSFLPNQLTSRCHKPDIRLLPFPTIWPESVSKTWYQTPSFPTNWPESVPKTWYQTPSFSTNWLVSAKNLISDYFLSNQLTSVCQQTDIRLLPS